MESTWNLGIPPPPPPRATYPIPHTTLPSTVARLICVLPRRTFGDISAVQPQTQKHSRRRRMRRVLESAWRLGFFFAAGVDLAIFVVVMIFHN